MKFTSTVVAGILTALLALSFPVITLAQFPGAPGAPGTPGAPGGGSSGGPPTGGGGGGGGGGNAGNPDFEYVRGLGEETGSVITILLVLVVSFALLFFFYGLAKFILNAGDESARQEGRNIMFWGIIALTVIVAVWGLVQVVATLFGVDGDQDNRRAPSVEELRQLN